MPVVFTSICMDIRIKYIRFGDRILGYSISLFTALRPEEGRGASFFVFTATVPIVAAAATSSTMTKRRFDRDKTAL